MYVMKNKQASFCLMILLLGLTSIAQADNITFTSPEKSSDVVRFAVISDLTGGAFTPADRGEYMDHILWVTMKDSEPRYLNITLTGMRTKKGVVSYTGLRPCFAQEACAE